MADEEADEAVTTDATIHFCIITAYRHLNYRKDANKVGRQRVSGRNNTPTYVSILNGMRRTVYIPPAPGEAKDGTLLQKPIPNFKRLGIIKTERNQNGAL